MTDELDTMTDPELSEAFATEMAGCKKEGPILIAAKRGAIFANWKNANGDWVCEPSFATDANAVFPWLEKHQTANAFVFGFWTVRIVCPCPRNIKILAEAEAKTFQRAACIALIRSKRAEIQQPPKPQGA